MSAVQDPTDESRTPTREALLKAAAALFAEKGPNAVSTREIASRANVNNGLIHRHCGTKNALLREVLEGLSAEISATEEEGEQSANLVRFFHALRESETYWKLIARTMLDGQPIDHVQQTFPTMERVVQLVRELQDQGKGVADVDPRVVSALLGAVAFGWLVYEPWLLAASGFEEHEKDEAGADVIRLVRSILTHKIS